MVVINRGRGIGVVHITYHSDVSFGPQSHHHVMAYASRLSRNDQKNQLFRDLVLDIDTMAPLKVHIKHAGKKYDVDLDPEKPPLVFKEAVYQVTGVPIDRMKVMVKGGVLKVRRDFQKPTSR